MSDPVAAVLAGTRSFWIEQGEAEKTIAGLPAASIDAMVTDPPAGISFMGQHWDGAHGGRRGWTEAMRLIFAECLRVMKPGAHALVWAIPRTSHWTATALEDAGFEIRDVVTHHFGSGFPKSLDVSKAIDGAAGAEREPDEYTGANFKNQVYGNGMGGGVTTAKGEPATDAAREWQGWGTALKPASEHWILCRKPLAGTVAANVQAHGTGALNVDGCRIPIADDDPNRIDTESRGGSVRSIGGRTAYSGGEIGRGPTLQHTAGRWPPNLLLTHAADCGEACAEGCPVAEMDRQSGESVSVEAVNRDPSASVGYGVASWPKRGASHTDSGGASRFYPRFRYVPKASSSERNAGLEGMPVQTKAQNAGAIRGGDDVSDRWRSEMENIHPTVKPIDLMRWLCRLVTPPGGVVLDPFAGSGTTIVAATREGLRAIGIEREKDYAEIALRRVEEDMPLFHRGPPMP